MDRMIATQPTTPFTLDQNIIYHRIISLRSFMKRTLEDLEDEFTIADQFSVKSFNRRKFYCFVGYIICLSKHNINYKIHFNKIDKSFLVHHYISLSYCLIEYIVI